MSRDKLSLQHLALKRVENHKVPHCSACSRKSISSHSHHHDPITLPRNSPDSQQGPCPDQNPVGRSPRRFSGNRIRRRLLSWHRRNKHHELRILLILLPPRTKHHLHLYSLQHPQRQLLRPNPAWTNSSQHNNTHLNNPQSRRLHNHTSPSS